MGLLRSLLCVLLLVSCGPRDDEKLLGGGDRGDGFGLKSGERISVAENNKKLPSCSKDDQPTWDSIRLFDELSFMYPKAGNLSVIVGKGDFNCVQVSDSQTVEIDFSDGTGWKGSGHHYYVYEIVMMPTEDLLNDNFKLKEVAQGMQMSVEQMKSFLNSQPTKAEVTLTYLKRKDGQTTEPEENLSISIYDELGKTMESCKDKVFTDLRVFPKEREILSQAIESKNLRAMVAPGDHNCLKIGDEASLSFKNEDGKFEVQEAKFKVQSIVVRDRSNFLEDPILSGYVASEMGVSLDLFMKIVEGLDKDKINVTRFEWVQ